MVRQTTKHEGRRFRWLAFRTDGRHLRQPNQSRCCSLAWRRDRLAAPRPQLFRAVLRVGVQQGEDCSQQETMIFSETGGKFRGSCVAKSRPIWAPQITIQAHRFRRLSFPAHIATKKGINSRDFSSFSAVHVIEKFCYSGSLLRPRLVEIMDEQPGLFAVELRLKFAAYTVMLLA